MVLQPSHLRLEVGQSALQVLCFRFRADLCIAEGLLHLAQLAGEVSDSFENRVCGRPLPTTGLMDALTQVRFELSHGRDKHAVRGVLRQLLKEREEGIAAEPLPKK